MTATCEYTRIVTAYRITVAVGGAEEAVAHGPHKRHQ